MQHEGYISKVALSVIIMWMAVLGALIAAWVVVVAMPERWLVGGMLAASACVLAAFTSTIHYRIYVARICGVVRATSGLEGERPPIRSIR